MANCALNANGGTTAAASDASDFANFMVLLGRSSTGPNDVQVETVNDAGTEAERAVLAHRPVLTRR